MSDFAATATTNFAQVDYGVDAPAVVRNLAIAGIGCLILATFATRLEFLSGLVGRIAIWFIGINGIICSLQAIYCYWSSKVGKLRQRDHILDSLALQGSEQVLDVGCGRGLLLLGAAKRLPKGKAIGVDLWQSEDLSKNSKEATLANARLEQVQTRVEVVTADMRKMPFEENYFDAVVSSLAVHNIYSKEGRREAIGEIYRVLKPGGRFLLQDIRHTKEYAQILKSLGAAEVSISQASFNIYGARVVSGSKRHSAPSDFRGES